jgi:hypothetical protein
MGKTSFKKNTDAPSTEATVVEETQLVTTEPAESAVVAYNPTADFTGSWSRSDVRLPRINLVQKSSDSKLITAFGIGSFVFNREVKLSDGKTPLSITVVGLDKDFQQKLPWGSKEEALVCRTPEEVRAAGGTLKFKGAEAGTYFQPRAHITLLLEMPAGISDEGESLFPYENGDKKYSVALMTVSSSGFTSMAKEIATLCTFNKVMRQGPIFGRLALTSEERSDSSKEWQVPIVKFDGANDPKLVEFFISLRGAK